MRAHPLLSHTAEGMEVAAEEGGEVKLIGGVAEPVRDESEGSSAPEGGGGLRLPAREVG